MLILWIIIITFNLNLNNDAQGPGKPYINDDNKCYRNKNFFFSENSQNRETCHIR